MLQICIKYFYIIFCSFYLYRKLLNLPFIKKDVCTHIISSILLALTVHYVRLYFAPASIIILIMLFITIVYLLYKQPANITTITSIIAMGCSYVLFVLATCFISPLHIPLTEILHNNEIIYLIALPFIGCLQLLLATFPFRFNRFKTGMPFLKKQDQSDVGVFISISLLIASAFFNDTLKYDSYLLIPIFFITLSGILIFLWWKHKLTESYLTKLKEREVNELQKQITELKENNETLSKIIHKDNKLVPSMFYEVQHVLTELGDKVSPKDREMLEAALAKLENLAKERKGILQFSDSKAKSAYVTGSPAIDNLLKYLAARAYAAQISFAVMISANVQMIIPDIISEADFRTMVADLVENALIAVKNETKRNVLFHTRIENNTFYVDIYDSGAPFAKEVLEKLGKEAITTHKNDGGSGIGYMSTFEILSRCNGRHEITENLNIENYTKKVSICFSLTE